jgi:hypothetical protein
MQCDMQTMPFQCGIMQIKVLLLNHVIQLAFEPRVDVPTNANKKQKCDNKRCEQKTPRKVLRC